MLINFDKKIGIVFILVHSIVYCKSETESKILPSNNINGSKGVDSSEHNRAIGSAHNSLEPNTNSNSSTISEAQNLEPMNRLKFDFVDNSEAAIMKLEAMISSGKFSDIFGKSFDDLHSNVSLNRSVKAPDGIFSQQSNAQPSRAQPKESGLDTFFYASSSDKHTSQNCYIVKIKSSVEKPVFEKLHDVFGMIEAKVYKRYKHGFLGYSICFPENTLPLALMREIPSIEFIERDNIVKAAQIQEDAPWGLARLSSPDPRSNYYSFDGTGQGVTVYVIDSGLSKTKELGERGTLGFTAFPDMPTDCAGHGTEVASVIAGTNVGVAKSANIVVAQVLDCLGDGKNSDLIDALTWIIETHQKPAIINMSLGGDRSPSIENAVKAAVAAGIPVVVAAGNSNVDACTQTPAAVFEAITVAASTPKNTKAKFSNFGPCVDIFAPGVDILAATTPEKSRNGWNFVSGTSFAAPMVAGVAALLLEKNPTWSPAQLAEFLKSFGAKAVLSTKTLRGSPNILLQAPSSNSRLPMLVQLAEPSYLPMLGYHTSSIVNAELILVICSFIGAALALVVTGLALYSRQRKIKLSNNASISEEDLKHSVLNSQRPSVFL